MFFAWLMTKGGNTLLADFFTLSKLRCSLGFMTLTLGVSVIVYGVFSKWFSRRHLPVLGWYGKNSLFCYMLCGGLGKALSAVVSDFATAGNIGGVLIAGGTVCIALTAFAAWLLYRNNIVLTV